jgi:hypothetical protein
MKDPKLLIRRAVNDVERLMFSATAEERLAMMTALVDRRIETTLERAFEALNEPDEDEGQDRPSQSGGAQ